MVASDILVGYHVVQCRTRPYLALLADVRRSVVNAHYAAALISITLATSPTASAFDFQVGPLRVCDTCGDGVVGGTRIDPSAVNPASPLVKALPLPPQVKHVHDEFEEGATNVQKAVEQTGNDFIEVATKAGGDTLITLAKASGDTITTLRNAGNDTVTTVEKAGSDVVATYEKGWRDTAELTKRSFNDVVDAGKAVARFAEAQAKGHVIELNNAARRAREGKVIDALWGAAIEPAQSSEKNFAKAVQESTVLNAAAQAAATAYGGPAGAAAYAAWYTYRATGDANLALKAGAFSIVTSYADLIATRSRSRNTSNRAGSRSLLNGQGRSADIWRSCAGTGGIRSIEGLFTER
jgi:hypothetical protein